jgi:hypothetical protein
MQRNLTVPENITYKCNKKDLPIPFFINFINYKEGKQVFESLGSNISRYGKISLCKVLLTPDKSYCT